MVAILAITGRFNFKDDWSRGDVSDGQEGERHSDTTPEGALSARPMPI